MKLSNEVQQHQQEGPGLLRILSLRDGVITQWVKKLLLKQEDPSSDSYYPHKSQGGRWSVSITVKWRCAAPWSLLDSQPV